MIVRTNSRARPSRRVARGPRPAAAAALCCLAPAGCRQRGLSLLDFVKTGVKDPQPPPYPGPVDGGRDAIVLGPLILTP